MKFEFVQTAQSEGSAGGPFLKLDTGESVNAVLRGNYYKFWQIWPQGGSKQIFDQPTSGAQMRFRVNVIVHEEGKFVAKIWEFPVMTNNMLVEIQKEVNLQTTKLKISRTGQGKKKAWMIIPLGPLDAKALKQVEAVELNILEPQQSANEAPTAKDEFGF